MTNTIDIYTDGSFNDRKPTISGWGFVCVIDNQMVHEDYGQSLPDSRQIGGELKSAMLAVLWAHKNGYNNVVIHHDYTGIAYFATGAWKPKKELAVKYTTFMNKAEKVINISFVKVKAHSGNPFNERADELAELGVTEG